MDRPWYNNTLCTGLGYESLRDWQLDGTITVCNGGDVICIVATGAGKSALIQGPIVALNAMGKKLIGIVIVPTKGLADDQARAATSKKLQALALHQDSVRAAACEDTPRDLFKEVATGKWSLVFLSPEMLASKRFNSLLETPSFVEQIGLLVVDECHLTEEWKSFREPYKKINTLRNRLPSRVAWVALSATIAPAELQTICKGLGFLPGQYKLIREPVDRPTIKYVPRFLQHSASSMLDFSTIIPYHMKSAQDVPITIIFVNTIGLGRTLRLYLTSLLPASFTGRARKYFIRGFHGMNSAEYRAKSIKALQEGTETRILLCTDTGAFGIDIPEVEQVVIAEISKTFKTQIQRTGRIRGTGIAIVYFPSWMSLEKKTKEAIRLRSKIEDVVIQFANPSVDHCPRQAACQHWGERFTQPPNCCNVHNRDENDTRHELELANRVQEAKRAATRNQTAVGDFPANSREYPALHKTRELPAVIKLLEEWRLRTWQSVPLRNPHEPAQLFLSDELLQRLAIRIRVCTSFQVFQSSMQQWEWLDQWGKQLYAIVETIVTTLKKIQQQGDSHSVKKEEDDDAINGNLLDPMTSNSCEPTEIVETGSQGNVRVEDSKELHREPGSRTPHGLQAGVTSRQLRKRKA